MPNNTFEDYKIAVKKKFKEEKEGRHSNYLSSPTRAKLRDLCWEIFERQDSHPDDLTVFNSFFGFPFDLATKNKFREEIDKFRPIETFFKEATDPTNVDAVNLGAILLDFHPRPFSKFRTCDLVGVDKESDNLSDLELHNKNADGALLIAGSENTATVGTKTAFFVGIKDRFLESLVKKSKWEIVGVALIFSLLFIVTYLAFLKKNACNGLMTIMKLLIVIWK